MAIWSEDMAHAHGLFRSLILAVAVLLLSGCSAWNGWVNRDIQENQIELVRQGGGIDERKDAEALNSHAASVLGMTATRRGVMIRVNKPNEALSAADYANPHVVFCAEPPPDAMQSFQAGFSGSIDRKDLGIAKVADAYSTAARSIAARTPVSDTYRTAVYSICQLFINGALSREEARDLFLKISLKALDTLVATAGKESLVESGEVQAAGPTTTKPEEATKPEEPASTAPKVPTAEGN
jgi:hypothetical protein